MGVSAHNLDVTSVADAVAIQKRFRKKIILEDRLPETINSIAGIDVGYEKKRNRSQAIITLMTFPSLDLICSAVGIQDTPFPYVPGLLSFREIPAVIRAYNALPEKPDLLFVDGQGIAHPRRMGIATHIGLLTDTPSIGIAKTRLTGTYDEPGPMRGDYSPLTEGEEDIGVVLRSRDHVKPVFVSPGHKVSIETARRLTMKVFSPYKLPVPTRTADILSKIKL